MVIDPDRGQPSASLLPVHTVPLEVQLFSVLAVSKPPFLMRFALLGVRHKQVLFVQLKEPDGQSWTTLHCLQVLLTHAGFGEEHVPQV